jgi:hypothetical protein
MRVAWRLWRAVGERCLAGVLGQGEKTSLVRGDNLHMLVLGCGTLHCGGVRPAAVKRIGYREPVHFVNCTSALFSRRQEVLHCKCGSAV